MPRYAFAYVEIGCANIGTVADYPDDATAVRAFKKEFAEQSGGEFKLVPWEANDSHSIYQVADDFDEDTSELNEEEIDEHILRIVADFNAIDSEGRIV